MTPALTAAARRRRIHHGVATQRVGRYDQTRPEEHHQRHQRDAPLECKQEVEAPLDVIASHLPRVVGLLGREEDSATLYHRSTHSRTLRRGCTTRTRPEWTGRRSWSCARRAPCTRSSRI